MADFDFTQLKGRMAQAGKGGHVELSDLERNALITNAMDGGSVDPEEVQELIDESLDGYYNKFEVDSSLNLKQNSSDIATINGSDITHGGNVVIEAIEGQTITVDPVPTASSENPVQSGGVITYVDENNEIFFDKTTIVQNPTNWLNVDTCEAGLINSAGTEFDDGSYNSYTRTDYIPVVAGKTYTYQYGGLTTTQGRSIRNISRHCLYDENKNRVGGSDTSVSSVTIPSGAAYIRWASYVTLANIKIQNSTFVEGTTPIDYSEYFEPINETTYTIKEEVCNDAHTNELIDEKLAAIELDETKIVRNRLPNICPQSADFIQGTNYWEKTFSWGGSDSTNNSYYTVYFDVNPNTQYFFHGGLYYGARSINEYDTNGNYIAGTSVGNVYTITTGANTYHLKVSLYTGQEDASEIREVVQNGATITSFMPRFVYVAVGRTIELYYDQIVLDAKKYHFQWFGKVGTALERKVKITITQSQADFPACLVIYDDALNVVGALQTTPKLVANSAPTKSIVPLGDSLTNAKRWLPEVVNLSSGNISFVGSYSWNLKDSNGNAKSGGHEGRSGFSAKDYATGKVYTYGEETQPNIWWNGSRFSLTAFETASGITPDVVQIWLGVNGLEEDNTQNAGYIKTLVDNIRLDNANIPIIVCNTQYKSNQNGIGSQGNTDGYSASSGAFKYNEDYKIMDLMRKVDSLLGSYSNVYIVNLAISHDSQYNYGWVETPVNPRASQTTYYPSDSVHPQAQGYFQIADILYSAYCAVLQ